MYNAELTQYATKRQFNQNQIHIYLMEVGSSALVWALPHLKYASYLLSQMKNSKIKSHCDLLPN